MTTMTFVGVFFNSLTNCITQSGIEYNPTPNISGDSPRSERLPHNCDQGGYDLSKRGNIKMLLYTYFPWCSINFN